MVNLTQKAVFLESDVATPISVFLDRIGTRRVGILLESAEVGGRWGRYSLVCVGALMHLSCRGGLLDIQTCDPRLEPLKVHQEKPFLEGLRNVIKDLDIYPDPDFMELPPITRALYGYLGYGLAGLMEPSLASLLKPQDAQAAMILPAEVLLFDHAYNRLVKLDLGGTELDLKVSAAAKQGSDEISVDPQRDEYIKKVIEGKDLIAKGELIQLVLSTGFEKSFAGSPFQIYRRLRHLNPSPYMFYLQIPTISLVVSSPEVMVTCGENRLRLCPIAGTRPRGQDSGQDDLFEAELAADPKEQSEHVMLVDLGRNDLGRVAARGTVELERYMEVERFSHVMHLTSHIGADLGAGFDAIDVLSATFPAGTLSGAPKIRAMELIAKMEGIDRGPYGGAMGWLGLDKSSVNLDLGITIRCLWVQNGRAYWRAGAGIVYDSEPAKEWKECLDKAAAVRAALQEAETEAKHVAAD
jgi:anthranilate synthase component 1